MANIKYKEFLDTFHKLRAISNKVYPDKYKYTCLQEGIKETTAMDMYAYFKMLMKGEMPYVDNKPLSDEQIAKIIDIGTRSQMSSFARYHLYIKDNEYNYQGKMVVWAPKDDEKDIQYSEFSLRNVEDYVTIGDLIKSGVNLYGILDQMDTIHNTSCCMSLTEKERGSRSFKVYEGDVILAYLKNPRWWGDDARHCGLYLCQGKAYHKLLYTPGKGYIRKSQPDIDEEFELNIGDDRFTSYVLTLGQKWQRIGNINISTDFLTEDKNV